MAGSGGLRGDILYFIKDQENVTRGGTQGVIHMLPEILRNLIRAIAHSYCDIL
jgi:hypothetical protein